MSSNLVVVQTMDPGRRLQRLKKPTNFADMSIIVTSRGAASVLHQERVVSARAPLKALT